MKGYKAFEKGLVCRGKQYAENTTFEEDCKPKLCKRGMHFCRNPLDVLEFYPLVNENGEVTEFAEVESLDDDHMESDGVKYCTKKLHIGAKINFAKLVQASVEFDKEKLEESPSEGYGARIASEGNDAIIASEGYGARIASEGNDAIIASEGNGARIASEGKHAVICCAGDGSKVKAKKGSWITLSEWEYNSEERRYMPICVKTVQVDGGNIKADTFYTLINGEFKEVQEDD